MKKEDIIDVQTTWTHQEQGKIASVYYHRPRKINVINLEFMTILRKAIAEASENPDLRCLILSGGGDKAFIGGADIKDMSQLAPDTAREYITTLHEVCLAIRDCPVPVIARIQGYCLGAGMEIAAACDMRIATTDAQFGMPEVQVGIPSVIEAVLLPRIIGWGKTNELLFTGKIIAATEAESIHFIERLVEKDQLDHALKEWTDDILNAGPRSIRTQKALIRKWESLDIDQGVQAGIDAFSDAYKTDEPKTYTQRFLNR